MGLQVSIFFPEQQHPRFGVVRAVVKDTSNDSNSSTAGQMVYLDSDDLVADNVDTPILNGPNPMADGQWHMVTVTTQPDSSTGFLMFLDGVEVGNMVAGNYTGEHQCHSCIAEPVRRSCCCGQHHLISNS